MWKNQIVAESKAIAELSHVTHGNYNLQQVAVCMCIILVPCMHVYKKVYSGEHPITILLAPLVADCDNINRLSVNIVPKVDTSCLAHADSGSRNT